MQPDRHPHKMTRFGVIGQPLARSMHDGKLVRGSILHALLVANSLIFLFFFFCTFLDFATFFESTSSKVSETSERIPYGDGLLLIACLSGLLWGKNPDTKKRGSARQRLKFFCIFFPGMTAFAAVCVSVFAMRIVPLTPLTGTFALALLLNTTLVIWHRYYD